MMSEIGNKQSLFDVYLIITFVNIEDSFLFLFPLISGIICLIGCGIIIYDNAYKINSVITKVIGLGFLLSFFFYYIPYERDFLPNAEIGIYICIIGFLLILFEVIYTLSGIGNEREQDKREGN